MSTAARTLSVRPYAGGAAKKPATKPAPNAGIGIGAAAPRWVGYTAAACPPLDDKETLRKVSELHGKLTEGKKPAPKDKEPHLVITIGPPGAGKSTIARLLVELKSSTPASEYVELDFDSLLDHFDVGDKIRDVADFAGKPTGVGFAYGWDNCIGNYDGIGEQVLLRLRRERYNLIVHSHNHETLMQAQIDGYVCSLLYVAVTPETALKRAIARAHALGRYIGPDASAENGWGWKGAVDRMWNRYRQMAPWFALWADNFVVVVNEADGARPAAADFEMYASHPPLTAEQDWHGVVSGLYAALDAAHKKAEAISPK